jgi:hypothetical protein
LKVSDEISLSGIGGVALVEQPHALANGDRVHQQVQLVQKTRGQQLADDRDRAAQRDVAARLVLQGGHGFDEVALELLGVPPGELELLGRHDDLAGIAERLGEAGVLPAGRLALRPRPGEAVVGLRPKRTVSAAPRVASTAPPISSLKYGKCH